MAEFTRLVGAVVLAVLGVTAAWAGAPGGARAATPASLDLVTVPALPGAELEVGGVRFVTDADGNATVDLPDVADGLPRLSVIDDGRDEADSDVRFSRWWGVSYTGDRIKARAVFDLYRRVTWSYTETDGRPVDPAVVSALVIRSSHGNVHEFARPDPVWLHAVRVVPSVGGLTPKEIDYRIDSALVDGAEVVIRGQQKFTAASQPHWKIQLLFFTARFSAFDAALGWPISGQIRVETPSKRVVAHELDARGELTLRLPRGTYRALVEAPGMQVWTPVALSRDQAIPIKVLTYLDMGLGASILAALAIGLLIAGRPHLVWRGAGRSARSGEPVSAPARDDVTTAAADADAGQAPVDVPVQTVAATGGEGPLATADSHAHFPPRPVPVPRLAQAVGLPARRPAVARPDDVDAAVDVPGDEQLVCPEGCPPSSPVARFCRYCGARRMPRPGPSRASGAQRPRARVLEGGHG